LPVRHRAGYWGNHNVLRRGIIFGRIRAAKSHHISRIL